MPESLKIGRLSLEIPEGWENRTTAIFVAPARPAHSLPTINRQEPTAAMSVSVTAPCGTDARDARSLLSGILADLPSLEIVDGPTPCSGHDDLRAEAVVSCRSTQGLNVRQLVVLIIAARQYVIFTGSAPRETFEEAQVQLRSLAQQLTFASVPHSRDQPAGEHNDDQS